MRQAQFAAVLSLALLGLLGGSLILSQDGFTTSSKRGEWSIFVSVPEAYVMAGIMFALSLLGGLWLLQEVRAKPAGYLLALVGYCGTVVLLSKGLAGLF